MCKAVRSQSPGGPQLEADIVVEDSALCAGPGGVQRAEEHLGRVMVELRDLCEHQRQIVLDVADRGLDCSLDAQELNRLVELEEDLVQELLTTRGEAPIPGNAVNGFLLCNFAAFRPTLEVDAKQ